MANTFKNASVANVANGSYSTLYTTPAATTTVVLGLSLANKTTNAVTVQCQFTDSSDSNATRQLLENVSIPQTPHLRYSLVRNIFWKQETFSKSSWNRVAD